MLFCFVIVNRFTQTRKKIKSTFINKNSAVLKARDVVQKQMHLFFENYNVVIVM